MTKQKNSSKNKMSSKTEKRDSERKACFIPVDYSASDKFHKDFIQNISSSGAFIESKKDMDIGTRILMTFNWLNSNRPVKSPGTIVRTSDLGFGVKFDFPVSMSV